MSRKLKDFTVEVPVWRPHVTPIDYEKADAAQLEALKETPSGTKIGDYVLVLAHDPEALTARTPLFNGIMYGRGGLKRAERELGAAAASVLNRCIYCTAVHASRYNQLAKEGETMQALFAQGPEAEGLDARKTAILRFAGKLSECPPAAGEAEIAALEDAGLDKAEILDLILSTALFGWANRLMHTLGEAVEKEEATA